MISVPRVRWFVALTCALVALFLLGRATPAWSLDREARVRDLLATVQVVVPDAAGKPVSSGSGTILDATQGYILTNYHVVGDTDAGKFFNDKGLAVIGVNPLNLRGVPIFKYVARVVQADPKIDLAVLQVVAPFDDPGARLPADLWLTSVDRGVSDELLIGDPIYVLGFPGLGGDTVTFTEGTVSGYLDEDRDGVEEWIKTDAEINHGNSGGLAVNDAGQFIGVPSAGYTDAEAAGKISLIRPGDMALAFYDRWTLTASPPPSADQPQVSSVAYGERVDRDGRVDQPMAALPSGIKEVVASFDFRNIRRGDLLSFHWWRDGKEIATGVVERGERETGVEWVNLKQDAGLQDGFYELEIRLGDATIYRGGVRVGGLAPSTVTIGPLTFAKGVNADGSAISPGRAFSDVDEVYAIFSTSGLHDGVVLKTVWSFEGKPVLENEKAWDQGNVEAAWLSISHADGLPVGRYELQVYIEGQLAQTSSFTVGTRVSGSAPGAINLIGRVYDANNQRRGVSGALVLLLNPGVTMQAWMDAHFGEQMIFARGTSTGDGSFQLDRRLGAGQTYGLATVQEDYRPMRQEGFLIPANASDPYTLDIPLERK